MGKRKSNNNEEYFPDDDSCDMETDQLVRKKRKHNQAKLQTISSLNQSINQNRTKLNNLENTIIQKVTSLWNNGLIDIPYFNMIKEIVKTKDTHSMFIDMIRKMNQAYKLTQQIEKQTFKKIDLQLKL